MPSHAVGGAQLTSPFEREDEGGGSARRLVEQMDVSRASSVLLSSSTVRLDEGEDIESLLLLFLASSRSREDLESELSNVCNSATILAAGDTSGKGMSVGIDVWSTSSVQPRHFARPPAVGDATATSCSSSAAAAAPPPPSSASPAAVSAQAHVSTRAELEPLDAAWFATSKYPRLVFELSSRAPLLYTRVRPGMWLYLVVVLNVLQAIVGIAAPNWDYLDVAQYTMYVIMSVLQLVHLGQVEWNILARLFWCADVHFMLVVNFIEQAIAGYIAAASVVGTVLYGVTYSLMMLVVVTLDACPRVPRWIKWLFTFSTAVFLFEVVLFFYLVPSPNIYVEVLGFFSIHLATTMSTCAVLVGTLTAVLSKRYWAHDTAMLRAPYAYFPTSDFRTAFDEQFARDHPARVARTATALQVAQSRRSPRPSSRPLTAASAANIGRRGPKPSSQQHVQIDSDDDRDGEFRKGLPHSHLMVSPPVTPTNRLYEGGYPTRAMVIVPLPSSGTEWMQLAGILREILLFGDDEEMDVLGAIVDHQVPARRVRIRTVEIEAAEATARRTPDVHLVLDHVAQPFLGPKNRSGSLSDTTSLVSRAGVQRHFLQLRPQVGKALLRSRPLVWIEAHQRFVLYDCPRLLPALFSVNVVVVLALSFVEGASVVHAVSRFCLSLLLAIISLQIMRDHLLLLSRSIEFWFLFWQIAVVAFIDVYVTIWCQRPLIITAAYVINGFFYALCAAALDAFRASPKLKGGIMALFVVYNLLCTVLQQVKTNQNYCGTEILLGSDTFVIHLNSWMMSTLLSVAYCQAKYAYRLLVAKWEFAMITHPMVEITVDEEHIKSLLNSVLWADE